MLTFRFVRNPLAALARRNRAALTKAGLTRVSLDTAAGPLVYWKGGSGPRVVFLHGAGDQAGSWSAVAARLAGSFSLVVPDLPGHGDSAPAAGPIAMGSIVDGVTRLLETEGKAVAVGNSLGAFVASSVAVARPDLVTRLVLVNGGPILGERPDLSLAPKSREEAGRLMEEIRDPSSPKVPGFVLDDVVRQARSGALSRLVPGEMVPFLLDGKLDSVRVPVDLLWGASDRMVPLTYAERLRAGLRAARLTVVERCGHVPQVECAERFGEALAKVLASPAPEASR
jgi:pimeloyl-ACP methyl ester carboxylesterase